MSSCKNIFFTSNYNENYKTTPMFGHLAFIFFYMCMDMCNNKEPTPAKRHLSRQLKKIIPGDLGWPCYPTLKSQQGLNSGPRFRALLLSYIMGAFEEKLYVVVQKHHGIVPTLTTWDRFNLLIRLLYQN